MRRRGCLDGCFTVLGAAVVLCVALAWCSARGQVTTGWGTPFRGELCVRFSAGLGEACPPEAYGPAQNTFMVSDHPTLMTTSGTLFITGPPPRPWPPHCPATVEGMRLDEAVYCLSKAVERLERKPYTGDE